MVVGEISIVVPEVGRGRGQRVDLSKFRFYDFDSDPEEEQQGEGNDFDYASVERLKDDKKQLWKNASEFDRTEGTLGQYSLLNGIIIYIRQWTSVNKLITTVYVSSHWINCVEM